jgi:hypothetical protein
MSFGDIAAFGYPDYPVLGYPLIYLITPGQVFEKQRRGTQVTQGYRP